MSFQDIQEDDPELEREEMAEDQFVVWLTEGKYDPSGEAATKTVNTLDELGEPRTVTLCRTFCSDKLFRK